MTITRSARGEANAAECEFTTMHLDEDGCQWCRSRCDQLPFSRLIKLEGDITGFTAEDKLIAQATDIGLELECLIHPAWHPQVMIELRTKKRKLKYALVLISVVSHDNQIVKTSANLIHPDVNNWLTAGFRFNRDGHETCRSAIAGIVSNPSLLAPTDWHLVNKAIHCATRQDERLAWATWANTQIRAMTSQ